MEVVCGTGRRRFKSRECSIRQERARDGWRTVGRDERVAAGGVRRFGDVVSGGGWVGLVVRVEVGKGVEKAWVAKPNDG